MDEHLSSVAGCQIRVVAGIGKYFFRLAADLRQLRLHRSGVLVSSTIFSTSSADMFWQRFADVSVFDLPCRFRRELGAACCKLVSSCSAPVTRRLTR